MMDTLKYNNCGDTMTVPFSPEICPSRMEKEGFANASFNGVKGGILQRDKKTYAVAPHIPGGIIADFNLIGVAALKKRLEPGNYRMTRPYLDPVTFWVIRGGLGDD